jgi:PhnB protein
MQTTIAPWLPVGDATRAVAWYQDGFGAAELYRLDDDAGGVAVAQLSVDGAAFWVQQEEPGEGVGRVARMVLTVDDPDGLFARAVGAGATEVFPVGEEHGWRTGRLADPFGHHWDIGRPLR